jgi:hypothetical protein
LCVAKTQNKEDLDAWATIKTPITREGMQGMWEEQPGFRQVMATFMRDLFELKDGHLEISENGYNILKPQGGLNRYKDRVASSLRDYINDLPNKDRILQNERVSINQIADAAVNAVDNFLFAMCMYDSGDVKRKIEDSNLYTEAPRAMMMPGVKGKAKWIKGELTEAPQGTEEGWGGKLGEWIRIRSERDKDFRKKVGNGELQYLPDRIVYGAFDHLLFDKSYVGGVDVNLSAALRYDDNRFKKIFINGRESGLYDYVEGSDAVDFTKLVAADLYDSWCNTRDSAKNIYTHLTAKDAKKVFSVEAGNIDTLINSYVRCANNPMLQAFYRDPQTVTAIYARAALPEGFNEYSSEILPPDVTHAGIEEYDRRVRRILEDDRIPRILGGDTKNALAWKSSIYYLLNAKEPGFNKYNTDHIVTGRRWKAVAAAVFEKTRVEVGNKL